MPSLVQPYAICLAKQVSHIAGDEELIEAKQVYLEAVKGRMQRGGPSSGFPSGCHFPIYFKECYIPLLCCAQGLCFLYRGLTHSIFDVL